MMTVSNLVVLPHVSFCKLYKDFTDILYTVRKSCQCAFL